MHYYPNLLRIQSQSFGKKLSLKSDWMRISKQTWDFIFDNGIIKL